MMFHSLNILIRPATGRMDCIIQPDKPLVVVDYAHAPDERWKKPSPPCAKSGSLKAGFGAYSAAAATATAANAR